MNGSTIISYYIPPELREDFSNPRGVLVAGSLKEFIELRQWTKVICLGDVVTAYCMEASRLPDVVAFDGKTQRAELKIVSEEDLKLKGFRLVTAVNPPGGLSLSSIDAMCRAISESSKGERVAIKVQGEEDMLTLATLSCAPANSLVIYGIPNRGAALVVVDTLISHELQTKLLRLRPITKAIS